MWRLSSSCEFTTHSELRSTSRQGVRAPSLGQASPLAHPFQMPKPPCLLVPGMKEKLTWRPWLFRKCGPRDLSLSLCSPLTSRLLLRELPLPVSILRVAMRIKWDLALWPYPHGRYSIKASVAVRLEPPRVPHDAHSTPLVSITDQSILQSQCCR